MTQSEKRGDRPLTGGEEAARPHVARQQASEMAPHHHDGGTLQRVVEEARGALEHATADLVAIRRQEMGVDGPDYRLTSPDEVTHRRGITPIERKVREAQQTMAASDQKLDLLSGVIGTLRQAVPPDAPFERGSSETREAYKGALARALNAVALEGEREAELQTALDRAEANKKAQTEGSRAPQGDLLTMPGEGAHSQPSVGSVEHLLARAQQERSAALSELSALREKLAPPAVLRIAEALQSETEQQRQEAFERKGALERQLESTIRLNERILRFRPQERIAMQQVEHTRAALQAAQAALRAFIPPVEATGTDEAARGRVSRWGERVREVWNRWMRG